METGAFQLERLHAISLHSGILLRKKDIAKLLWRRLFFVINRNNGLHRVFWREASHVGQWRHLSCAQQEVTMGMAQPNANLISSDKVEGTDVYDASGSKIGEIDHLMIDRVSGMVRYAVMTFGGFLGIGEGEHPLPWKAFRYDTNLGGYVANVTEEQLQNAPEYAGEENWADRDWETRLNKNYGSAPYWEETSTSASTRDESARGW
jgi:hypothetical protein